MVDLQAAGLHGVARDGDGVHIGATTTLSELATHELLAPYAAVRAAASAAASPLLRNIGTVGGNLCQGTRCWYFRGHEWNCWLGGGDTCFAQIGDHRKHNLQPGDCISAHPSDLAPALAACGAVVVVARPDGVRDLPLLDLYRRPTEDDRSLLTLGPGEVVTTVRLPAPPAASAYERARRAAGLLVPAGLRRRGPQRRRRAPGRGGRRQRAGRARRRRRPGRAARQPAERLEAPRARHARPTRPGGRRMIATIVLAAGAASRFGSPKLFAEWWGRPLVEHALDVAPDDGPRVAVVGRETVRLRPLFAAHGFATVVNPRPSRGLASSLRTGLEVLPAEVEAALVLLGDAPVVPPAAIDRVLTAYRRENRAVGASYEGQRGHPVLLPRDTWERLPKTGERAGATIDFVPVECGDLAEGAADVDTPDDLFEIAARAARAPLVARLRNIGSLEARLEPAGPVRAALGRRRGRADARGRRVPGRGAGRRRHAARPGDGARPRPGGHRPGGRGVRGADRVGPLRRRRTSTTLMKCLVRCQRSGGATGGAVVRRTAEDSDSRD